MPGDAVFESDSNLEPKGNSLRSAHRKGGGQASSVKNSKSLSREPHPISVIHQIKYESKRNRRLLLLFALCCGIIVLGLTLAYPKVDTIVNGSSSEVAINPHPPILAVSVEARILADTGSLKVTELFLAPAKPEALQAGFHRKLMRTLKVYDIENKELGYTELRAFVAESTDQGSHWEDFKELQIESTDEGPFKKVRMYAPGTEKTAGPDSVIPELVLNPDATHYLLRFEYSLNNAYAIQETETGAQAIYEWHVLQAVRFQVPKVEVKLYLPELMDPSDVHSEVVAYAIEETREDISIKKTEIASQSLRDEFLTTRLGEASPLLTLGERTLADGTRTKALFPGENLAVLLKFNASYLAAFKSKGGI